MTVILGIKMKDRTDNAVDFQSILTEHGCAIKTRIGLHNIHNGACSPCGIILLEILETEHALVVEKELLEIDGIEIQRMAFDN